MKNPGDSAGALSGLPAASSPLKKPPGEGTGPTMHADFRGNLVGRVPSRGERDVFQQTASSRRRKVLSDSSAGKMPAALWRFMECPLDFDAVHGDQNLRIARQRLGLRQSSGAFGWLACIAKAPEDW